MAHDAKHRKSRKGGAAKMILIVLLILGLAAGGCLLAIRKEINGSASAGEPVSVSIQQGSGSRFSAFPSENATGNFVKIVQRVPVKIVIDKGLDPNKPLPLGLSVEPKVTVE